jgi:hypothetical protein
LEEVIHFPGDTTISYLVEPVPGTPGASFQDGVIRIGAPQDQLRAWVNTDAIGMYFDFPANGSRLRVAIEKDLECLDGPEEERDPDAYPRSADSAC